ncbi:MAG: hypothetical protein ACMXYM_00025 [Candidatus Woesearchaeota archaeon]
MNEPHESRHNDTDGELDDLVVRFSTWFTQLKPADQNAAYLLTSGLANAAARETSMRTPGFFEKYVSGANEANVARHDQTYGSYASHAARLSPPMPPRALAQVGQLLLLFEGP